MYQGTRIDMVRYDSGVLGEHGNSEIAESIIFQVSHV
jgi:hypothetical protein